MVDEQEVKPEVEVKIEAPAETVATEVEKSQPSLSRGATIRKWFFYILIGGLIVSAAISVVAVLIGGINDIVSRSLWTTLIMVVHSLIAVGLLSASTSERNTVADGVALNILVGLTIASFITATLGVWEVLSGSVVGDVYQLIFYALIADVLIFTLLHSRFSDTAIARSARISIGITVAFFVYLIPSVFSDSLSYTLPDIYNRGIAAFSILLSTSVVVTVIYHWVYTLKHRDQRARERSEAIARGETVPVAPTQSPMPTWLKVLLIIIGVVFGLPFVLAILGMVILAMSRLT